MINKKKNNLTSGVSKPSMYFCKQINRLLIRSALKGGCFCFSRESTNFLSSSFSSTQRKATVFSFARAKLTTSLLVNYIYRLKKRSAHEKQARGWPLERDATLEKLFGKFAKLSKVGSRSQKLTGC